MEVKVISRETIKPSVEQHHQTFKLSLLDQISPPTYTPLILFYPASSSDADHFSPAVAAVRLKTSLSDALSYFPLIAGAIKDHSVDCNGLGATFSEAKIDCRMSDILEPPRFEITDQLLPCGIRCTGKLELSVQVAAQLNVFACGGIAIGVCLLHKIMDGTSLGYFLKSWASISKGTFQNSNLFDYNQISELFPQRELKFSWLSGESPFISKGNSQERRFVFKPEKMSTLKSIATSKTVPNPTTVEVITGFIWKHALKAVWEKSGSRNPSVMSHAVNLRKRKRPPLPEGFTGNLFWHALAYYDGGADEPPLAEMVDLVRKSFEEISCHYVEKMVGFEGFDHISNSLKQAREMRGKKVSSFGFSSWLKMGINEVDFGWGKPLWVCKGGATTGMLRNIVLLVESGCGDGIQAWIDLDYDEMMILENDPQFLAFASLNPPVGNNFRSTNGQFGDC